MIKHIIHFASFSSETCKKITPTTTGRSIRTLIERSSGFTLTPNLTKVNTAMFQMLMSFKIGMIRNIHFLLTLFWSYALILTTNSGVNASDRWDFQFEGKTSFWSVDSLSLPYKSGSETAGFLYTINTISNLQLLDSLHFIVSDRLRASSSDSLFPEQLYPFENYLHGEFEFSGPGRITFGGSNTQFKNAQSFPTPWYLGSSRIKPEMLNSIDGGWDIETERLTAAASASYLMYKYTMQPNDLFLDSTLINAPPYGTQWDNDMWAELSASFALSDDFAINVGGLTKLDLNTFDGYNLYRIQAGVSGNHQMLRNRFRIEWNLVERLTNSTLMKDNGYATGFSTLVHSRILLRIKSDFFIKGGFRGEFGKGLHKIWYEAQLRKTWNNGSNIDIGYIGSSGVLFPRYGLKIASKLVLHPHFALAASFAGYFSRFARDQYRYYRSDAGLELIIPVVRSKICLEFFCGGNLRHYDRHPLYSSRRMVCAGLRLW